MWKKRAATDVNYSGNFWDMTGITMSSMFGSTNIFWGEEITKCLQNYVFVPERVGWIETEKKREENVSKIKLQPLFVYKETSEMVHVSVMSQFCGHL